MSQICRKSFYYLRHGQTDWNVQRLCIGQRDIPLNATGYQQAKSAAPIVQSLNIGVVYSSPLSRALVTAEIVSGKKFEVVIEQDLREACLGIKETAYEGDPYDDFTNAWLMGAEISAAETFTHLQHRIIGAVNRCLAHESSELPLIVAHSAVYRAILSVCGLEFQSIEHCQPLLFTPASTGWIIGSAV